MDEISHRLRTPGLVALCICAIAHFRKDIAGGSNLPQN